MHYYETLVVANNYKRTEPLTYRASQKLLPGQMLTVPLQRKHVPAVVLRTVPKPAFSVKAVASVVDVPPLPEQLLGLAQWMTNFYRAPIGQTMLQFLPSDLYKSLHTQGITTTTKTKLADLPPLTSEQASVLAQIDAATTYLLHGDTGTGKTRIYLELARRTLAQDRSCVILTPEISLTPQLTLAFQQAFESETVITTHSGMSPASRRQLWLRALTSSRPLVIIGPRSALFMPLKDVGLIVLDEAHDQAYKQEQIPRYHASKVAAKLAELHRATLVLGSGTPALNDYYLATAKNRPILRMTNPARSSAIPRPDLSVVDLKDRKKFRSQQQLSNELLGKIADSLNNKQQSLLFLNRRGTARVVLCDQCGWQASCVHCNLPLTYHGDNHTLRCHTCGNQTPALPACPACGNAAITLKSIGTKAIANALQQHFPEARIARFDSDNPKSERLDQHYQALKSGEIDIVVGTQMIAKGLDLPRLSVVGVVIADTSLYFPDYSASERTYQLLRQVVGRVGRGHIPGTIIVQTYNPDSPVIKAALANDWDSFYNTELLERQHYGFPPYYFVLKVTIKRASSASAAKASQNVRQKLAASGLALLLDGPAPAFHEKQNNQYVWQLIVKAKQREQLLHAIDLLPSNCAYDLDPLDLL
jgi:primosomal protein N' (replication factor Y)